MFSFIGSPIGGAFAFFFIFSMFLEWIGIPAVVVANWRIEERWRLLLWAAVLYYVSRATTYLYFVPAIFELGQVDPAGRIRPT